MWRLWFLVIIVAMVAVDGAASAVDTSPRLRLQAVIQQSLDNNRELRALGSEALKTYADIGPEGSYEDPTLAFEAMNYPVDTFNAREFGMTGNQLSLSQKIEFPGKLSKRRRAATFEYEALKALVFNRQLELIRDVKVSYYSLFLTFKRLDILIEQRNLIRQLIAVMRSRFTLGRATQAEVLALQVEDATIYGLILETETQIKTKAAELGNMMGRMPEFGATGALSRPEELQKTKVDLGKVTEKILLKSVLERNPRLKSGGARVSAAQAKVSFARWNYLPDFEFMLGYTFRQPSMGDRGTDFLSARVSMSLPIWAMSKQSEVLKGAGAELVRAEANLDAERLALGRAIHVAYASLEEAKKKCEVYEGGLLQLARQAVVSGRSSYVAGKLEYAALLNSIRTRYQTEYSYLEALVNFETRIAELEAYLDGPLVAQGG